MASNATTTGGVTSDRLRDLASELGISEEALRQAELKHQTQRAEKEEAEEMKRLRREHVVRTLARTGIGLAVIVGSIGLRHSDPQAISSLAFFSACLVAILVKKLNVPDEHLRRRARRSYQRRFDGPRVRTILDDIALREPSKIEAISELRTRLDLTLLEAKDAVEGYNVENGRIFR